MVDFPSNSHLQFDFLFTMTGLNFGRGTRELVLQQLRHLRTAASRHRCGGTESQIAHGHPKLPATVLDGARACRCRTSGRYPKLSSATGRRHLHQYRDQGPTGSRRHPADLVIHGCSRPHLIIACINFVNLSTAKSANRAREVGMRKVVGAFRGQLVRQFLTESVLFSVLSFAGGMVLAWWLLPLFNQLSERSLTFPWQEGWFFHSW